MNKTVTGCISIVALIASAGCVGPQYRPNCVAKSACVASTLIIKGHDSVIITRGSTDDPEVGHRQAATINPDGTLQFWKVVGNPVVVKCRKPGWYRPTERMTLAESARRTRPKREVGQYLAEIKQFITGRKE